MSQSLSDIEVGANHGDPILAQVNSLIIYARNFSIDVIRITPSGDVFLDGEKHGELNDFRPEDVNSVFQTLYRMGGMSPEDEPPYIGECQWPTQSPVTKIRIACVPVNPTTVEVVLRFVGL